MTVDWDTTEEAWVVSISEGIPLTANRWLQVGLREYDLDSCLILHPPFILYFFEEGDAHRALDKFRSRLH